MRLIKSNNIEPEYPKRCICNKCGAELEYDKADVHIGWLGYEYVTCLACNKEIEVSDKRVQPLTWSVTFHHTNAETSAVDIEDDKIQKYVNEVAKRLCLDEYKSGEYYITAFGNPLIVGLKWGSCVDIYVIKDYWVDSINLEDYKDVVYNV